MYIVTYIAFHTPFTSILYLHSTEEMCNVLILNLIELHTFLGKMWQVERIPEEIQRILRPSVWFIYGQRATARHICLCVIW